MHDFTHFSTAILLFGAIIVIGVSNVCPVSNNVNALTSNGTNERPFNVSTSSTYHVLQRISPDDKTTETRNNADPSQNVSDAPVLKQPILWIIVLSFILAIAIVSGIFIFVAYILTGSEMEFGDIIRDGSGFPSLAKFQFLLWTFIIMFAVLSVYFIRLFMGTPELPNSIPANLLILTGISVAVPFVSNPISSIKYGDRKPPKGTMKKDDRRRLATMLMENEKPTVSRFQMFAWTVISIIIYLAFFFSKTTFLLNDVNSLTVPDIPQIFVFLMGLSQTAYVGNKATVSKSLAVLQVAPNKAPAGADVIVLGTNFGEKGRVLFEDGPKEIAGNQVIVQPDDIKEWQDNRIQLKVPTQGLVQNRDYYVRVANGGAMSYKAGGQDEEAKFTMQ